MFLLRFLVLVEDAFPKTYNIHIFWFGQTLVRQVMLLLG